MIQKISILSLLLFFSTHTFGQPVSRDSQRIIADSLKAALESLQRKASGCTDFTLAAKPGWADSALHPIVYYRNCAWSGTYIILNADSTFLYKYNSEGSANYLQKGYWKTENDSILVLRGIDQLTRGFIEQMKPVERTKYKFSIIFEQRYVRKGNTLLRHDK